MSRTNSQSGTGLCPPRDDLAAFNRGELPDPDLEALAEHLSACTECASTLEGLRGEDTAGAGLREALRGPPVTEPGFEALEAHVRGLLPDLSVTAVEADGPAGAGWALPGAFGGYELLERLGHGGVGVVYKARQPGLNRLVALKHLRAGPYAEPEEQARFRTEGEALARVRHPNVVQVYEVGEQEGQLYLSMELVEGGSLARRLADGPLPERAAAELVCAVARAVGAIHRAGVVHRDLKPGNVLLGADGAARVADFGLAKLLDAEAEHTQTGAVLGTASYMAPEQAEGHSRHVGPATDVWALGAILYECLTGRRPFQGPSRSATLEQVRLREPPRPRHWRRLCPDLEAVCLKCLEKQPAKRYASAEALADDLGRWLDGRPTLARPLGRAGRVKRWLARHPWRGAAAALGLLAALGAGAAWALHDPDRPVKQAETQLARGEAITLIGPTGGPRWSRWAERGPESQTAAGRDGAFAVHSDDSLALVELARAVRLPRYRLRGEVWHTGSNEEGAVGLYFAYGTPSGGAGPVHYFGALTYNDIRDEVAFWRAHIAPNLPKGTPPPDGNRLFLGPHLHAPGDGPPSITLPRRRAFFKPHGYGGRWRQVVVEVTPDGVEGLLDGASQGRRPAAQWEKENREHLGGLQRAQPNTAYIQGLDLPYRTGGAVGLYVLRGSASFRRVAVEPLGPPN